MGSRGMAIALLPGMSKQTFAVTLGETTLVRCTRGEMLEMLKRDFGVTAVKRGYTTWRIIADGVTVGRVEEV